MSTNLHEAPCFEVLQAEPRAACLLKGALDHSATLSAQCCFYVRILQTAAMLVPVSSCPQRSVTDRKGPLITHLFEMWTSKGQGSLSTASV